MQDTGASPPTPPRPQGRALVRRVYLPRIVGVALCGLCVLTALPGRDSHVLYWVLGLYTLLVWPNLAYAWASRAAHPLRAERINLWVDSLHAGFWMAAIDFSLIPSATLLMATSLGNITVGGTRFLLLGLTGHGVGVLLGGAVWGWRFEPASGLAAQLGALPLLLIYPLLMGRLMYGLATQLKQSRRELRHQSEHDALSGVYNRRYFDQALRLAHHQYQRHPRPMTLLICDADDFKQINDRHGHAAGDRVIRQVAEALVRCARAGDVVARLGGDEFVVLLSDTDVEQAMHYARRVRDTLDGLMRAAPEPLHMSLSFGAAMAHPGLRDHGQWLERADAALYRSKSSGRGQLSLDEHPPTPIERAAA